MKHKLYASFIVYITVLALLLTLLPVNSVYAASDKSKQNYINTVAVEPNIYDYFSNVYIYANYYGRIDKELNIDYSKVAKAYKSKKFPMDGIFGYGECSGKLTVQPLDAKGHSVGKVRTIHGNFLINFPSAAKLRIKGNSDISINFIPTKPLLITDDTTVNSENLKWIKQPGGMLMTYVILAEGIIYVPSSYESYFPGILPIRGDTSYHAVEIQFSGEPTSDLVFKKLNKLIESPKLLFYGFDKSKLYADYEEKLTNINDLVIKTGGSFLPGYIFDKQVFIEESGDYTFSGGAAKGIALTSNVLGLAEPDDYYDHVMSFVNYYCYQDLHYGMKIAAWDYGIRSTFVQEVMNALAQPDVKMFIANFIGHVDISDEDKKKFEDYYVNAPGNEAPLLGYQFTRYLREVYGENVVLRITKNIYKAGIYERNSKNDKKFLDCIKTATSKDVFDKFVKSYLNQY